MEKPAVDESLEERIIYLAPEDSSALEPRGSLDEVQVGENLAVSEET